MCYGKLSKVRRPIAGAYLRWKGLDILWVELLGAAFLRVHRLCRCSEDRGSFCWSIGIARHTAMLCWSKYQEVGRKLDEQIRGVDVFRKRTISGKSEVYMSQRQQSAGAVGRGLW